MAGPSNTCVAVQKYYPWLELSLMARSRGSLESVSTSPGLPRYGNPRWAGVA